MEDTKQLTAQEIAEEWIRNNPHVAMRLAVEAHAKHWFGCACVLDTVATQQGLK